MKLTRANSVKVMTLNVRFDNPDDELNKWSNRKGYIAENIRRNDIDILGTQELLSNQLKDLLAALPQYTYAGVGRNDGKTLGEYNAILYKKERFSCYDGGTFWLSEDPAAIGAKGWDAQIERIATWVVLKDKTSGGKLVFFNTHFDHVGQVAKRESARLVLSRMKDIAGDLPVFLSGDLNSVPGSEPYKIFTSTLDSFYLTDSRAIAQVITGPDWSYHGFGSIPVEERGLIDFIFVRNIAIVEQVSVIFENQNNLYLSDHNPVLSIVLVR